MPSTTIPKVTGTPEPPVSIYDLHLVYLKFGHKLIYLLKIYSILYYNHWRQKWIFLLEKFEIWFDMYLQEEKYIIYVLATIRRNSTNRHIVQRIIRFILAFYYHESYLVWTIESWNAIKYIKLPGYALLLFHHRNKPKISSLFLMIVPWKGISKII